MNRDALVSAAGQQLFLGVVVALGGNLLAGAVGSFVAAAYAPALGLFVYLVVALPALYVGCRRVARCLWVVAEGAVHAANGSN